MMDELYTPKVKMWNREAFIDSLYSEKKEKLPSDNKMYTTDNYLTGYPRDPDSMLALVPQNSYLSDFARIKQGDPRFHDFVQLDYLSYYLALQLPMKEPYTSPTFSTILVHENYQRGIFNPGESVKVFIFIPISMIEMESSGFRLINKVYVNNTSSKPTGTITGQFRFPVAITNDRSCGNFDNQNCEIYDENWMLIKMIVPANHFIKR